MFPKSAPPLARIIIHSTRTKFFSLSEALRVSTFLAFPWRKVLVNMCQLGLSGTDLLSRCQLINGPGVFETAAQLLRIIVLEDSRSF
jgi:hypothetical protein